MIVRGVSVIVRDVSVIVIVRDVSVIVRGVSVIVRGVSVIVRDVSVIVPDVFVIVIVRDVSVIVRDVPVVISRSVTLGGLQTTGVHVCIDDSLPPELNRDADRGGRCTRVKIQPAVRGRRRSRRQWRLGGAAGSGGRWSRPTRTAAVYPAGRNSERARPRRQPAGLPAARETR